MLDQLTALKCSKASVLCGGIDNVIAIPQLQCCCSMKTRRLSKVCTLRPFCSPVFTCLGLHSARDLLDPRGRISLSSTVHDCTLILLLCCNKIMCAGFLVPDFIAPQSACLLHKSIPTHAPPPPPHTHTCARTHTHTHTHTHTMYTHTHTQPYFVSGGARQERWCILSQVPQHTTWPAPLPAHGSHS